MAVKKKNAGVTDILKSIASVGTAKPKAATSTKWEMELDNSSLESAKQWVSAKTLFDLVETRLNNSKSELMEYSLGVMAKKLFDNKSQPSNPIVYIRDDNGKVDHQFQIVMADNLKFVNNLPKDIDPHEHYVNLLTSVGLTVANAERLVEEELDFDPAVGVKTLTELLQGKYIEGREYVESTQLEKQAGAKLAAFLQYSEGDDAPEAMTDEEKAAAVQHTSGMVIKAGFYDRLATYCRNVDEVMGVFSIFKPVIYANYAKFCVNGTAADKVGRLATVAEEIIGNLIVDE